MGDKSINVKAVFDQDSKRFHRFLIKAGQEVSGSIYIPKGSAIPESVTIQLLSQDEDEKR
jgi:hypothetical protein